MYFTYAISSTIKKYIYIGISNDVKRRFNEHNNGYNKITSPYRPFKIILVEKFNTRIEARQREKYFKSGHGREFLKSISKNK